MRSVLSTVAGAALVAAVAVLLLDPGLAIGGGGASATSPQSSSSMVAAGRQLYVSGCSSCHGMDANGTRNIAPSLHGVGALAADFELRTGRMPLPELGIEPIRTHPRYSEQEIRRLVAYVGSLGGPGVPRVDLASGSISEGQRLYTENCAGCHQSVIRGGIVTGAFVPPLTQSTPTQIAEAIHFGPYLMPRFNLSDREVASIAKFVAGSRNPAHPGGAGIGYIGPVPEGMVTWLAALPVLLLVTRLIGKRSER